DPAGRQAHASPRRSSSQSTSPACTSSTSRPATVSTTARSPAADPAAQQPERLVVAAPAQEVEVAALVCLENVLDIERAVAPRVSRLDGAELLEPPRELACRNV